MDKLRVNSFGRSAAHETAARDGLYAAENLEVEQHATQSSKAQMQELLDGQWQVVHTNADNVFWWVEDNGADFVIVMAPPSTPGQNLVVRPEITTLADLRGKPLAVDAAESGYVTPFRVLLAQAGLTQEGRDYTFVEVGNTQFRIDAMRDGRAFGAMLGAGAEKPLLDDGFRVLDNINRLYTDYAGSVTARRSWIERNDDVLVRYLRAHVRALGSSPPPFLWSGLTAMLETRREVGLLRGAPDPHRFADDSWYRRAIASL